MTTSKEAFDLALAFTGKSVVVRNIKTGDKLAMDLIQLIPGLPVIGVCLHNGEPKNWSSTPVTFITAGDSSGPGELADGELMVRTTSGGYILSPVLSSGRMQGGVIFEEKVYCGITRSVSSRVEVSFYHHGHKG
ncbi:MAG: hypothetical protein WC444_00270 [Candidatus Paceibacterota bacterium]